jgi:hypothetical protein
VIWPWVIARKGVEHGETRTRLPGTARLGRPGATEADLAWLEMHLARQPQDLRSHSRRVQLARRSGNREAIYGALVDLFIALAGRGVGLKSALLSQTAMQLGPPERLSGSPSGQRPACRPEHRAPPAPLGPQPRPDRQAQPRAFGRKSMMTAHNTLRLCHSGMDKRSLYAFELFLSRVGPNACQISGEESADVAFIDLDNELGPYLLEGHRLLYPAGR